jgi:Mrp family chromosome partitioning ATPase
MGRMLETLKLGEGRRSPLTVSVPEPQTPVQDCVVDWEIGEEVPYIEVGGPGKKVDLSPGMLLQHPPQSAQPPHAGVEKAFAGTGVKVVNLTEARPMTVAFEPWPETPAPMSIAPEIIAVHQPEHPISKEYALLLEKMLSGLKTTRPCALLLIGLKPHAGTSTVLLNLAGIAALKKHRVVVVDANGVRAGLAQRLGRFAAGGLEEVMHGTLALEQAVVKTAIPSLHLLPAGAPAKNQRPLTAEAMTWISAWLRERFDLVFIDGPSMEDAAAVSIQAPHADGTYLVLSQGAGPSDHKGIAHSISRMGGRLCGLIHTHFEM